MKQKIMVIALLFLLLATTTLAGAQTGGGFDLNWATVDGGGGQSSGWSDTGVSGDPVNNYTYVIRASNDCGESANSQRLGAYNFAIVPGIN